MHTHWADPREVEALATCRPEAAITSGASGPLPLLCACHLLAGGLEHGPLDRHHPLLEAAWAGPREARGGCKLIRELEFAHARVRVLVDGRAEAACQQLTTFVEGVDGGAGEGVGGEDDGSCKRALSSARKDGGALLPS